MKHLLILLLFGNLYAFGQSFSTKESYPVATGNGYHHPQIEIAGDNLPLVSWTHSSEQSVYIAKHNGIDGFNAPIRLNPDGFPIQSYSWSGPDIAIDGSNVYVVFRSYGYEIGHVYIVKSTDYGATFSDTIRVDNLADGFPQFPDITAMNDTVWVTFMDHDAAGMNPEYVVARSVDGGLTFESEVAGGALLGDEACDCCPPEIIVNENYVILFFRNNASNIRDIKAVVSLDRGASFSEWFSVDDHMWSIMSCPSTGPDARFLDPHTIVSVYKTEVSGESKIFINEYDVASDVSNGLVEIYNEGGSPMSRNYPQVAVNDGNIGVVWEGFESSTDVFINASSSGVAGFLPENAMNLTNAVNIQGKPDIALTANTFHVVYADIPSNAIHYMALQYLLSDESIDQKPVLIQQLDNTLRFQIELEGLVQIFSVSGQVILEKTITDQSSIDLNRLPKGTYIVKVSSGNQEQIKKIIVF